MRPWKWFFILINCFITNISKLCHLEVLKPYVSTFRSSLKHIWPNGDVKLQLQILACLICLLLERFAVVLVPYILANITHYLGFDDAQFSAACQLVLLYSLVKAASGFTGRGGVLSSLHFILWLDVEHSFKKRLQLDLYRRLYNMPLQWFTERKLGETLQVITRGVDSLEGLVSMFLFRILPPVSDAAIAILYYSYNFDVKLSGILFVTLTTYLIISVKLARGRLTRRKRYIEAMQKAYGKHVDALTNIETVKYFGAEEHEILVFGQHFEKCQLQEKIVFRTSQKLATYMDLLMGLGFTFASVYCVRLITDKTSFQLTSDDFVAYTTHISTILIDFTWLGYTFVSMVDVLADIEGIQPVLEADRDVKDAQDASDICLSQGEIEFKDVSFKYKPSDDNNWVLKSLSFTVPPGHTVAIVGPSGSGKTTIIKLLYRLYEVQKGHIYIDGQDVTKTTKASLRKAFGLVPQDSVLFNETLEYNIKYGSFSASKYEVELAAKKAQIHEKIVSLDDGYQSMAGDRGCQLSGGEKQRVAIARALLKSPKIMLLDEATASLDAKTETEVQKTLKEVCGSRTTLMIAHKLHTVVDADKILVLKDGEIMESGNHVELLAQDGLYAEMWTKQDQ